MLLSISSDLIPFYGQASPLEPSIVHIIFTEDSSGICKLGSANMISNQELFIVWKSDRHSKTANASDKSPNLIILREAVLLAQVRTSDSPESGVQIEYRPDF